MATRHGVISLQKRLPILGCVSPCTATVASSLTLKNSSAQGKKTRRRLILTIGASFWTQSLIMISPSVGAKSFVACASIKGPSVEEILKNVEWPEQFPFKKKISSGLMNLRRLKYPPSCFRNWSITIYDNIMLSDKTAMSYVKTLESSMSPDTVFYESPRFVTHIDDPAIAALTKYYSNVLPPSNTPGVSILDMCSSWVSHYPKGYKQERIVGQGLNEEELKRNPVLTESVVQDLNQNPKLPFEDNSFDVITNVVSVDYLTKPLDVFKEMCRILKPGGLAIMSFSNRCFWTKAISIWTSTGDADHIWIVGSYFHYAGGFEHPQAVDISPNPGRTDPMYIVYSRKLPKV